MFQAYRVIDESDQEITYQYNTLCSWWIYACLGLIVATVLTDMVMFAGFGTLLLVVYLALAYFPAIKVAKSIKASMQAGKIQITGSRWSFSNPLTITVPRYPVTEGDV